MVAHRIPSRITPSLRVFLEEEMLRKLQSFFKNCESGTSPQQGHCCLLENLELLNSAKFVVLTLFAFSTENWLPQQISQPLSLFGKRKKKVEVYITR
ncbi:hypothetical protein C5167_026564 [Papaver somniferum]|nr:hypothetical protein C5167_026564 [Papaver somniferum]